MDRPTVPTVVVVEDERPLADVYARWLADTYDVRTAYGGEEALELIDEAVDVVLLDRRMPDLSGYEVLEWIREKELGCRVAMVTAVDPEVDVVEMEFDEYLTKPVDGQELRDTVARLVELNSYEDLVQEYFSIASKLATLQANVPASELDASDEYRALERRFARVKGEVRPYLDHAMDADASSDLVGSMVPDPEDDDRSDGAEPPE